MRLLGVGEQVLLGYDLKILRSLPLLPPASDSVGCIYLLISEGSGLLSPKGPQGPVRPSAASSAS